VDIEDQASTLVVTTDPTVARQLHELDRALAQVPQEQGQVILLVGLEGMSYEHTASILQIPVGTVGSRLSRGPASLRGLMGMEDKTDAKSSGNNNFLPEDAAITTRALAA